MNKGFYKDLDTNFEQALVLSAKNFSHDEIINLLKTGNIPEKQIASLKFDKILSQEEADILVSNLTGCDGKIRESVALSINRMLYKDLSLIKYFNQAEVFANASIDINANICRLVIESVEILIQNLVFLEKYKTKILQFIAEAFEELDNFIYRDKKYVINKQLFKLYWCLEALKLFADSIEPELLYSILKRASIEREYTIREKVAQILVLLKDERYANLKQTLANDENYYVRIALTLKN